MILLLIRGPLKYIYKKGKYEELQLLLVNLIRL